MLRVLTRGMAAAVCSVTLVACGSPGKAPHQPDFAGLVETDASAGDNDSDNKADYEQPSGRSKSLGEITYGATKTFYHSGYPNFRSFWFDGTSGDEVQIDVAASGADSEIWLVDASTTVVGYNDDRSSATYDSRITAKLPKSGRFRILMQEYDYAAASFTVTLKKKSSGGGSTAAMLACTKDADCTAIANPACCQGWRQVAVNKSSVAAYTNQNQCAPPYPPCAPPPDPDVVGNAESQKVAQCNTTTKRCEMIHPDDIKCGGFIANPHTCPSTWICIEPVNDQPGDCHRGCVYEGKEYLAGDTWKTADFCNDCSCTVDGTSSCTKKLCPACDYTPTTKRKYKLQSPVSCQTQWFLCKVGEHRFDDHCGCGCEKDE